MKMNKMAAGALALALGLGAVAPAVAAEKSNYSGAQLVLEKYEAQLKDVNAKRDAALAAQARIDEAAKRLNNAKEKVAAAEKAYKSQFSVAVYDKDGNLKSPEELSRITLNQEYGKVNAAYGWPAKVDDTDKAHIDAAITAYKNTAKPDGNDAAARKAAEKALNDVYANDALKVSAYELSNRLSSFSNAVAAYVNSMDQGSKVQQLYNELVASLAERTAAQSNYDSVYAANHSKVTTYETAVEGLKRWAETYGYVVQIGNNGVKLVKDGEGKIKAPGKTDIARLEEVKAQAEKTLEAAKLIIKNWPETVKNVRKDLDALIEKQEKNIKLAEERIKASKKVSLVSTAYAEEDNRSDDQLIEDMLSTDKEINDKLDANEKKAKEENEKKPEEKKPEDKKDEEKKPEEKKPAKEAGKNVKTGVAGIAGVAGILAAASVAYAASKRD